MIRKKYIAFIIHLVVLIIAVGNAGAQQVPGKDAGVIYSDNFQSDKRNWVVEFEQPENSEMKIGQGRLEVTASAGATVWFKYKLHGNIMVTYYVSVVDAGGKNDRVSDMNTFWMATNPLGDTIFQQDGKFSSYDNLHLYYAGIGGHDNTTTRFRKYAGKEGKKVLKEFTDPSHLLVGNHKYAIRIIVKNGIVQYFRDDVLFWEFHDESPYREGYFGFRTTISHHVYEDFKVYRLE